MKPSLVIAALAGLTTAQDLSKYHLSWCAEKIVKHSSRFLTGLERNNVESPYSHCVYTLEGEALFDYHCLCSGGDGEGSAIMSEALQLDHGRVNCGWDRLFGT